LTKILIDRTDYDFEQLLYQVVLTKHLTYFFNMKIADKYLIR